MGRLTIAALGYRLGDKSEVWRSYPSELAANLVSCGTIGDDEREISPITTKAVRAVPSALIGCQLSYTPQDIVQFLPSPQRKSHHQQRAALPSVRNVRTAEVRKVL